MTVAYYSFGSVWTPALEEIGTLGPGRWVSFYVLDLYLLHVWYNRPGYNRGVRYIDASTVSQREDTFTDEELQAQVQTPLRRRFLLPPEGKIPITPVAYVILHNSHFVVVVQDTEAKTVHVVGSMCQKALVRQEWLDCHGDIIMAHVCRIHGWPTPDPHTVTIRHVAPPQNGYDCALVVVQVAMSLFREGLQLDASGNLKTPLMECAHNIRLHMYDLFKNTIIPKLHQEHERRRLFPLHMRWEWKTWVTTCLEDSAPSLDEEGHPSLLQLSFGAEEEKAP
ncbi:uncharacterized protein BXZ73DRAFT_108791 [Epithele typhae]|uniref:uncharacterized protein n=1 Tax=Epithele typhae TaxID=378194 RepID=UPI002007764A|nr:uncharacterized protein BXZ73DRAFT_108791 [Epithele typhae]KAH9910586.1 hypothetical protein BXZ73DRAFT_108791 [Epithele typhae]